MDGSFLRRSHPPLLLGALAFADWVYFLRSGRNAQWSNHLPGRRRTASGLPTTTPNYPFPTANEEKGLQSKARFETIKHCVFRHFSPTVVDARIFLGAGGRMFKSCRPDFWPLAKNREQMGESRK